MAIIREVDWLELPDHLTSFVTDKLSRCDFIRFGAVCKSWLSVYAKHPRHSLPHQIPLLLLRYDDDDPRIFNFYDLGEKRLSRLQVSVRRAGALTAGTSRGSSHGWLPVVWRENHQLQVWRENHQLQVCLTNPFLSEDKNIKLPYVNLNYCWTDYGLINVVLSADPALEPNFLVMLIIDYGRLAFLKPASDNTDWTYLDTQSEYIEDAIYYRDQFYFVDSSGALFVCELNDLLDPPKAVLVAPSPCSTIEHEYDYNKVFHLVELLSGDLLLAKKLRKYTKNELYFYTGGFSTYKMNPLVELKWMEVHNLCGETVYLDKYSSMSLMVSEFPECKPNCIYFVEAGYFYMNRSGITVHDDEDDDEDSWYRPYYVGVFNLVDGTVIERCCSLENPTTFFFHPPFWIEPRLYRHC